MIRMLHNQTGEQECAHEATDWRRTFQNINNKLMLIFLIVTERLFWLSTFSMVATIMRTCSLRCLSVLMWKMFNFWVLLLGCLAPCLRSSHCVSQFCTSCRWLCWDPAESLILWPALMQQPI
ncbi:hypothetical protein BDR07DRAFT_1399249 [Suillus spraguei]|nr:hypothetical protein BDR07DRAFT_1399249 [Suillus spraguei]